MAKIRKILLGVCIMIALSIALYFIRRATTGYLAEWGSMERVVLRAKPVDDRPYNLPKIIWAYWNTQTVPPAVKKIMDDRAAVLVGWECRVLNDTTIHEYLDELPANYDTLRQSHKSDWLRLALLERYGGCWLDATVIVNSLEAFNAVYADTVDNQSEFTGFYTPMGLLGSDPTSFIESWFIMAPEKSRVIRAWLSEFTAACTMGFSEYRSAVMRDQPFSSHIYNRSGDTYLTVYAAAQVAIQRRLERQVNILLYNSYKTMYRLHYDCWNFWRVDYDSLCIVNKLENEKSYVKEVPFIKLTNAQHSLLRDNNSIN